MKLSDRFIMRTVADESILIPIGDAALSVKGLIVLSESGALLCEKLKNGAERDELVSTLLDEYDVSPDEAARDTDEFLSSLRDHGMIVEE